jgi:hypothetical protein
VNRFHTIGPLAVTLAGLLAVLSVAACSPGTATSGQAASPAASPVRLSITSTLDGHAMLPELISWVATPSVPPSDVAEVDFLIDGKVTWIEYQAPYVFGGDDNGANRGFLFTTWLSPGMHTFTALAIDTAGHKSANTVTARVPLAPQPPAALKGVWTRIMSGPDITKAGVTQAPPPTGRWEIVFNHVGAWELDPTGSGAVSGIGVQGDIINVYAPIQMAPWVNNQTTTSAFGHHSIGGTDCTAAGPFGTYRWSVSGSHLTLTPVHEGCPNRQAVWAGVWSWVGPTS